MTKGAKISFFSYDVKEILIEIWLPLMQTLFMQQICKQSGQSFTISEEDKKFLDRLSPVINGKKYALPQPQLHPRIRQQHRLAFRNERNLYKTKCGLCNSEIITSFSPDKPYKVYCPKCFWSDKWDAKNFGREFNFDRPFFEQFEEVVIETPRLSLTSDPFAVENNCTYINFAGNCKNCYMIFDSDYNEDSYYSNVLKHSQSCMDCSYVNKSELCYECIDCAHCYNLYYSQDCTTCIDSYFLKNCKGCSNCFLCINLANKKYHILNKQYTKDEYEKMIDKYELNKRSSLPELKEKLNELIKEHPHKFRHAIKTENCSGDYLLNAKNCFDCYDIGEGEDLNHCDSLYNAKDCMDVSSFGEKIEKVYMSTTVGLSCYDVLFCLESLDNANANYYSHETRSSKNVFGCASATKVQHCILNKQYSKEEYPKMVGRIIDHMHSTGEWGKFFPLSMSSYGYNESVAQEFYPLSKEEAQKIGAKWKEPVDKEYKKTHVDIPDDIKDVPDEITNEILTCTDCGKNYKIAIQELNFYRKHSLPIPSICPDCRHTARISKRNPRRFWKRKCDKCGKDLVTSYSPDRPETIYCEKCYLGAVY